MGLNHPRIQFECICRAAQAKIFNLHVLPGPSLVLLARVHRDRVFHHKLMLFNSHFRKRKKVRYI